MKQPARRLRSYGANEQKQEHQTINISPRRGEDQPEACVLRAEEEPEDWTLNFLTLSTQHSVLSLLFQSGGDFSFYLPGEQFRRSVRQQPHNCLQARKSRSHFFDVVAIPSQHFRARLAGP